jgi:hypothetical protein
LQILLRSVFAHGLDSLGRAVSICTHALVVNVSRQETRELEVDELHLHLWWVYEIIVRTRTQQHTAWEKQTIIWCEPNKHIGPLDVTMHQAELVHTRKSFEQALHVASQMLRVGWPEA